MAGYKAGKLKETITKKFYKRSFLYRLLVTTLVAALIPVSIISFRMVQNEQRNVILSAEKQLQNVAVSAALQFDRFVGNIEAIRNKFAITPIFYRNSMTDSVQNEKNALETIKYYYEMLPFASSLTLYDYLKSHDCMGDTVGRFANRIRNGRICIDGRNIQLPLNGGKHHIHGGYVGFGYRIWQAELHENADSDQLIFHRISPDGEEGYPGTLDVTVSYSWNNAHQLAIRYDASTDQPTICNLTNHSYFNLSAMKEPDIGGHRVQIFADRFLEADEEHCPTGKILSVEQTPLDFRNPRLMKDAFRDCEAYDHTYLFDPVDGLKKAAVVTHEASGRQMTAYTDQSAMQLFTSNGSHFPNGKAGVCYGNHCGLCLEMQNCPDSPNHPEFGVSAVLLPDESYHRETVYAFSLIPNNQF